VKSLRTRLRSTSLARWRSHQDSNVEALESTQTQHIYIEGFLHKTGKGEHALSRAWRRRWVTLESDPSIGYHCLHYFADRTRYAHAQIDTPARCIHRPRRQALTSAAPLSLSLHLPLCLSLLCMCAARSLAARSCFQRPRSHCLWPTSPPQRSTCACHRGLAAARTPGLPRTFCLTCSTSSHRTACMPSQRSRPRSFSDGFDRFLES
jgi:hypothetical protein